MPRGHGKDRVWQRLAVPGPPRDYALENFSGARDRTARHTSAHRNGCGVRTLATHGDSPSIKYPKRHASRVLPNGMKDLGRSASPVTSSLCAMGDPWATNLGVPELTE